MSWRKRRNGDTFLSWRFTKKKKLEGKTKISVQQSRNVRLVTTIVSPIDRRNDRTCSKKKKKKKRISLRAPFISFRHPAFCQTFHFYLRVSCFLAPAPTTPSSASFSSSPRPTFSSSTTFGFLYNFCLPSWGYHHCRKQKGNVYDRLITANSREQGT